MPTRLTPQRRRTRLSTAIPESGQSSILPSTPRSAKFAILVSQVRTGVVPAGRGMVEGGEEGLKADAAGAGTFSGRNEGSGR